MFAKTADMKSKWINEIRKAMQVSTCQHVLWFHCDSGLDLFKLVQLIFSIVYNENKFEAMKFKLV